ncbi:MAG: hypothetical protein HY235_27540 [Acidobacteria bacterium]|nr:hypothetical protein [Acidobacteriota bacterium]
MRVRIRFQEGPQVRRTAGKNRHLAAAAAALLTPAAVAAAVLGVWRICADIGLAREFAIPQGIFSHWQVWLALAGLLQLGAFLLNRYGSLRRTPRIPG